MVDGAGRWSNARTRVVGGEGGGGGGGDFTWCGGGGWELLQAAPYHPLPAVQQTRGLCYNAIQYSTESAGGWCSKVEGESGKGSSQESGYATHGSVGGAFQRRRRHAHASGHVCLSIFVRSKARQCDSSRMGSHGRCPSSAAAAASRAAQQHLLPAELEARLGKGGAAEEGLQVVDVEVAAPLLQLPALVTGQGAADGRSSEERQAAAARCSAAPRPAQRRPCCSCEPSPCCAGPRPQEHGKTARV